MKNLSLRDSESICFVTSDSYAIAMVDKTTATLSFQEHLLTNSKKDKQAVRDFLKENNISYEKET